MKQGKTFHGTDFNRNFTLNIGTTVFFFVFCNRRTFFQFHSIKAKASSYDSIKAKTSSYILYKYK